MLIRIFLSHFETLSNLINAPQNIFDLLMGEIGTDYDECLLGDVNESLLEAECVFSILLDAEFIRRTSTGSVVILHSQTDDRTSRGTA